MSAYGWTIDQFLDCQPKHINSLIHRLSVREHNDYAAAAALHGHKMEFRQAIQPTIETSKLTPEQQQAANRMLNQTLNRNKRTNGKK